MKVYPLIVTTPVYKQGKEYPPTVGAGVMVCFTGGAAWADLLAGGAWVRSCGYSPLEVWGWERTIEGIPAPVMGAVGLMTVEHMVIGVRGAVDLSGIGETPESARSVFSFNIPPPPATRPRALYLLLQEMFKAEAVASYGLTDVPGAWDRYGI